MSDRPPRLGLVADRRIREAAALAAPRLDVRGPVAKTVGRTGTARPPGAGLTRRERRVRALLVQELEKMPGGSKTWTAKLEREHLVETLDAAFIDREIAKMERTLRPRPLLWGALGVLAAGFVGLKVATHLGEPLSWVAALDVAIGVLWPLSIAASIYFARASTRRRLWIYQALCELSDADDEDVQLPASVALADLLIDRIVEAEDAAARRTPLPRIRS